METLYKKPDNLTLSGGERAKDVEPGNYSIKGDPWAYEVKPDGTFVATNPQTGRRIPVKSGDEYYMTILSALKTRNPTKTSAPFTPKTMGASKIDQVAGSMMDDTPSGPPMPATGPSSKTKDVPVEPAGHSSRTKDVEDEPESEESPKAPSGPMGGEDFSEVGGKVAEFFSTPTSAALNSKIASGFGKAAENLGSLIERLRS